MEKNTNGEVSVKELPLMRVATCFATGRAPEAEVIGYLERWIHRNGLDYKKLRKFGMDIPVSESQQRLGLRSYEFWVTVPESVPPSGGIKIRYVNPAKYAVLRIKNPFKDPETVIRAGWNMLYDWVIAHKEKKEKKGDEENKQEDEKFMLEEVVETKDGVCLDLYLPMELNYE